MEHFANHTVWEATMTHMSSEHVCTLSREEWLPKRQQHIAEIRSVTAPWLQKRKRGEKDPIEDFLYDYYSVKPKKLEHWNPGIGIELEDAPEYVGKKWFTETKAGVMFDHQQFMEHREQAVRFIHKLLTLTKNRPARFGCFGWHEWAMVYRQDESELRHQQLPLRLGQKETDRQVEGAQITCSHFDAYRFFTPEARPLNALEPTRERQEWFEQPGCLHVGMDNFKWALKLGPVVPGEVLREAFVLSREIRYLDMQASPYDLSALGVEAVKIETEEGKKEYQRLQKMFAERGQTVRQKLIDAIEAVAALTGTDLLPVLKLSVR